MSELKPMLNVAELVAIIFLLLGIGYYFGENQGRRNQRQEDFRHRLACLERIYKSIRTKTFWPSTEYDQVELAMDGKMEQCLKGESGK